jgi:hypothetical protein
MTSKEKQRRRIARYRRQTMNAAGVTTTALAAAVEEDGEAKPVSWQMAYSWRNGLKSSRNLDAAFQRLTGKPPKPPKTDKADAAAHAA